jgi:hypothetical protein
MATKNTLLPPMTVAELLERYNLNLRGWYVESAEGILAPYRSDPEKTIELAKQMKELSLRSAA